MTSKEWLTKHNKQPKKICNNRWRWVLPDHPNSNLPYELPERIFNKLNGPYKFPWIFDSFQEAMEAAEKALDVTELP